MSQAHQPAQSTTICFHFDGWPQQVKHINFARKLETGTVSDCPFICWKLAIADAGYAHLASTSAGMYDSSKKTLIGDTILDLELNIERWRLAGHDQAGNTGKGCSAIMPSLLCIPNSRLV